jgi:hypothetical protein
VHVIAGSAGLDPQNVIIKNEGNSLSPLFLLSDLRTRSVQVSVMSDFVFKVLRGGDLSLTVHLRRDALLSDAQEQISQRLAVRPEFVRFTKFEKQITKLDQRLTSLGELTVSFLEPTNSSVEFLLMSSLLFSMTSNLTTI